jgi:hypothetical protein
MGIREKLERIMIAITFAEAGQHETARKVLEEQKRKYWYKRTVRQKPRHPLRSPRLQ